MNRTNSTSEEQELLIKVTLLSITLSQLQFYMLYILTFIFSGGGILQKTLGLPICPSTMPNT